ncbi:1-acyl-sn-glycerol-3-phosphate acyltransferase [Kitasatospora sp. NBC_00315]|uniref:1-acyl-sn-glycerol-3-phosphate acyltransferase n=1 Tax=Kitasatospora sp. NBC_00315 TaxID=2975963 RepID=UPI00324D73EC
MSGWLPTAPCTPETCVTGPGPTVPVPRRVLRCAALAAVLVGGLLLAPLLRDRRPPSTTCGPAGRQGGAGVPALPAERLMRGWCRLLVAAAGVRIRTAGPAGARGRAYGGASGGAAAGDEAVGGGAVGGGALLVANHVSWLDILLIQAVRPGRMLAKTEVRGWPLIGRLAAGIGTIFIERDRLRTLPRTVEEIAAALRRGEHVVVFPEGSTWCGQGGGRFRPAAFQAALEAGAPVQPVTIRYRLAGGEPTTAPAFVGEDGLLSSLWRVVTVRGLVGELTLLPRIPAGRHPERRSLAGAAQTSVQGHRAPSGPHRVLPGPHRVPAGPPHVPAGTPHVPAVSAHVPAGTAGGQRRTAGVGSRVAATATGRGGAAPHG